MKLLSAAVILLSLPASGTSHGQERGGVAPATSPQRSQTINHSQTIEITRNGSQQSSMGPAEYFTGSVHIAPLFDAHEPSRAIGASVTFEPGARTAWHTHPLGQILIVTEGIGWIQQWGGPVLEIRKGDVVWTPPGTKHWHGATSNTTMTHIAITERLDGKVVEWMEKVSDEQYHNR